MTKQLIDVLGCVVLCVALADALVIRKGTPEESLARLNYSPEVEAAINDQINMELWASYAYMSMSWYFDRDDVALKGFHKFFADMAFEEWEHGQWFIEFQNLRGGRFKLKKIMAAGDVWGSGLDAMKTAIGMEKTVTQALLDLHALALTHNDAVTADWLAVTFLEEQAETVKKMANWITIMESEGDRSFDSYLSEHADKHEKHSEGDHHS